MVSDFCCGHFDEVMALADSYLVLATHDQSFIKLT